MRGEVKLREGKSLGRGCVVAVMTGGTQHFYVVVIVGAGGGCLHTWAAYEIALSVSSNVYIS
jgi:hypothetical protein